MNDFSLHCFHKRGIFTLWVNDDYIGIRVGQNDIRHFFLCGKGFSCTRHTENKGIAVKELPAVGDNHIFADNILTVIHTVFMVDFLHTERDKHCKALCCEGTQGIYLPYTKWQGCIQSVHLLIFQHRKLAQMLSCGSQESFCIIVELLFGICRMHHRQHGKHHSLVTGCQIIQKFLAFFSLLFQIIGDNGRKIVVLVLLPLPIRDIGFHTKQTVFHLPHGFICGNGDNINGQHHIPVQLTKLRNHTVLDICRILSEKNHTPISVTHSEAVALKFKGIRADKILEIVTFPHRLGNIEVERCFFSCTVEVVEDTQLVACVQFHTLRPQTVKVGDKVSTHTGEVVSGFLDILLADRYGYILILYDGISPCRLIQKHFVVFLAVLIQTVISHWD